ncbi:hypothetical protein C1752_10436 [Acaryochloris thomasi RCC1774]|uniref:TraD/TraG TraM recognition site domain-containing protein n=1 Tax=Acaryochloris thomasi RCC1774 TaxID=1764569 RepID=A0A2W1J8Z3_9CYAN|nr:TraM recognition domain-containing protein [Acaryochloris thomasi]PZD70586.1 hypothetical protein C1752_10436 [Acaryochloris thomasi RCC1774]
MTDFLEVQPSDPSLVRYAKNNPARLGMLSACVLAVLLLQVFAGQTKKTKLAKGHLAKGLEKKNALNLMKQQQAAKKLTKTAFNIRQPGQKGFLAVPNAQPGVLVLGSPGAGKTASVINPLVRSAIDQGHRIIMFDWKYPDQASQLVPYAAARGYKRINVFAPGFAESQRINPLDLIESPEDMIGAQELALSILQNDSKVNTDSTTQFFLDSAASLLAPIFCVVKGCQYPDLLTVLMILQSENLIERLKSAKIGRYQRLMLQQAIATAGSPKQLAGLLTSTIKPLTNFLLGDNMINAVVGASSFDPILRPKEMIVFGMDRNNSEALKPLIGSTLRMTMKNNLLNKCGVPLIASLDELSTLELPITEWLNTNRSDGFVGLIGLQNLEQCDKDRRRELKTGCPTKMLFNPNDDETAEMFSKWLGKEQVGTKSKTEGWSSGKRSRSTSGREQAVDMLQAADILKQPEGVALVLNSGHRNAKEASVPFRHRFTYTSKDEAQEAKLQGLWEEACLPRLVGRAPAMTGEVDAMIKARRNEAKKLLGNPDKGTHRGPKGGNK